MEENQVRTAWLQSWEESERGWGTRPDGYSIHPTEVAAKLWANDYMQRQAKILGTEVPEEYTRPAGVPYEVYIDDELAEKLDQNGHVRVFKRGDSMPKPVAESSGWRPRPAKEMPVTEAVKHLFDEIKNCSGFISIGVSDNPDKIYVYVKKGTTDQKLLALETYKSFPVDVQEITAVRPIKTALEKETDFSG